MLAVVQSRSSCWMIFFILAAMGKIAPSLAAQPYYAPGSSVQLYASCVGWPGGNPYYPCNLTITSNGWNVMSNAHTRSGSYHPTPIPSSAVRFTSSAVWSHSLNTTLNAPNAAITLKVGERENYPNSTEIRKLISHEEYLSACATGGVCSNYQYVVGYTDIFWIEQKPNWLHIGQRAEHENSTNANHWMMSDPAYGIWNVTNAFLALHPSPWGGCSTYQHNGSQAIGSTTGERLSTCAPSPACTPSRVTRPRNLQLSAL
jgi:hypothetical protein